MQFEHDIFISYAHLDDLPVIKGEEGWVTVFHQSLAAFVAQYLGRLPKIWRDAKLQGNGVFDQAIIDNLQTAAVLISILSPRYVESDWCQRELATFSDSATAGIATCPFEQRLFKVVKYPLSGEQSLPSMLEPVLGYQFFEIDPIDERPRDIRPEFGPEMKAMYLQRIADLALEIKDQLQQLTAIDVPTSPEPLDSSAPKATIYLAETTQDLNAARDNIRRELERRGYVVLPEHRLLLEPNFAQAVKAALEGCTLSIHLVGERYGTVPEGEEQSVIALQHQLAQSHHQSDPRFSALIWTPPNLTDPEPRQAAFLQSLQNEGQLLKMGIEDFKDLIFDSLTPRPATPTLPPLQNGPLRLYLICDQADTAAIMPLSDYLYDAGLEVILPWFGEDEAQVRQDHQANLALCDVVLLYYGQGNELWQREQWQYLQRVERFGERTEPLLAKAIVLSDPVTPAKERFRTREAVLIEDFGDFDPSCFAPFIRQLTSQSGGNG